jgi:hypothetical protein
MVGENMGVLTKDDVLHLRGGDGKLLPQKVTLETLEGEEKPEIEVLPMTRGQIAETFKDYTENPGKASETELDIVEKYCINPKLSKEELANFGKVNMVQAIVFAIMSLSTGVPQSKMLEKKNEALAGNSDFLSKGK